MHAGEDAAQRSLLALREQARYGKAGEQTDEKTEQKPHSDSASPRLKLVELIAALAAESNRQPLACFWR